jgi:glycosyltransferase involved in cell wall biosynthesis
MVKNPMLLLQCIKQLTDIDNEYRLFMVGKPLQLEVENYLKHMITALGLENNVFWEGWRDDMDNWFSDKHYIVSTSVIESQGMGILEGMARGLKPVIHNFPGAEGTFGDKYLFNTVNQFCEQVLSEDYRPLEYRQFVEAKYPLSGQLKQVSRVLEALGARIPVSTS